MILEIASLRNLIAAMDDAQRLQDGLSFGATQPYLQKLFERLARAHASATRDFVVWVFRAGGNARRGGSPLGALRARDATWRVRVSLDPEMVCTALAEHSEARVLRRFRAAATRLHDGELRDQVQTHRREIEHAFMQLNSFGCLMRAR